MDNSKWISIIGCTGLFEQKTGKLNIYKFLQTVQMQGGKSPTIQCMVVSVDYRYVYITFDGNFSVSKIPKKFCRII